jgi:hypothetical protein
MVGLLSPIIMIHVLKESKVGWQAMQRNAMQTIRA